MSLKNPVTPPGIDPGTVRLIAQRLNHYATPGPPTTTTTTTTTTVTTSKVKQSRNRPGVAQRAPGGLGSQIFMTFGT